MLTRAEVKDRLHAMAPALEGMTNTDVIALLLLLLEAVASASDDPAGAWAYIAAQCECRAATFDGEDDTADWGHA